MPRWLPLVALLVACAGSNAVDMQSADPALWSDADKCDHMCQSYCLHKHMCDDSSVEACRMSIDEAGGGGCADRAHLFHDFSGEQVKACIDAIQRMSCGAFLHMFDTGEGVPAECDGILS